MWSIPFHSGTQLTKPPFGERLAGLARRQHGVVSLGQLVRLGLSASGVRGRVQRGELHRIHRGVYAVGHPLLTTDGRYMAAVLACGSGGVLSHRSAASLWDLRPDNRPAVDVSSTRQAGRSRDGIDLHRTTALPADQVTRLHGVPCTTVARTLVDLGDVLDGRGLERAVERAEQLRIFDLRAVDVVLAGSWGRRGASRLIALLADIRRPAPTRNELENAFLELVRNARIPEPQVNVWIPFPDGRGAEADFLWPDLALVVETDGRETHDTHRAFESDRLRDQRLTLAGYQVIRFTWRQLLDEPERVATTVAALVGARSAGAAAS